jgi:hypothetical protein
VIVDGEKMKILDRYASAVNSSNLTVEERTTWSDTDVVGAAGLASRYAPLGVALTRFFAGGKSDDVVDCMTQMAFRRARTLRLQLSQVQAKDLATAVLSWYRFGNCQPCSGRGQQVILNTPLLGEECKRCNGTGRLIFEKQFKEDVLELAKWLSGEIDRAQPVAGQVAMALIAPRLDF